MCTTLPGNNIGKKEFATPPPPPPLQQTATATQRSQPAAAADADTQALRQAVTPRTSLLGGSAKPAEDTARQPGDRRRSLLGG